MVSEWMDHGNINKFIKEHEGVNRVQLVSVQYIFRRSTLPIYSAGRRYERVRIHAQHPHGARRLERGILIYKLLGDRELNDIQANILVNKNSRACLADFGLSTIVEIERRAATSSGLISAAPGTSLMSFTDGGTARWMSPELHHPEKFGITDYRPTKQSDCYALGMVIYEVRADAIFPTVKMV